jgi:hypothetical protein
MNNKEEKELKKLINKLDKIFLPFNKTICTKCGSMCCCNGCHNNKGYFSNIKIFKERAKAYKFNKEKGFLTENGCSIPRELRSHVCLRFTCTKMEKKYSCNISGINIYISRHRSYINFVRDNSLWHRIRKIVERITELRGY